MLSPEDMPTIYIDITNACPNSCSNCSRFCGHHKKPFFMEFGVFKKCVDSLKDFNGSVAIIGGEPTIHPEFAKICNYLKNNFEEEHTSHPTYGPIVDFAKAYPPSVYLDPDSVPDKHDPVSRIRILFSIAGSSYYKHYETIEDTFDLKLLNDHVKPTIHSTLMITREEMGIPDAVWFPIRDNCFTQKTSYATMTPKGGFFCAFAASMDMLLDGPGGWPIEPGWWKRKPEDFGSQLDWCELCNGAIPSILPPRASTSEIDDASPGWLKKLNDIESPKLHKGKVEIFDLENIPEACGDIFVEGDLVRTPQDPQYKNLSALSLIPQHISYISDMHEIDPSVTDWVLLCKGGLQPIPQFLKFIQSSIFNPGCFHWSGNMERGIFFFNVRASSFQRTLDILKLKEGYPQEKIIKLSPRDTFPVYSFKCGSPKEIADTVKTTPGVELD